MNATERASSSATKIEVFTDGACSGNPGPGGWGVVLYYWKGDTLSERLELSDAEHDTTNNRMELSAALSALIHIRKRDDFDQSTPIIIVSDSQYVVSGFTKWLPNWVSNGWRGADKKPVKNQDLWKAFQLAANSLSVALEWVRGHSGHEGNEAADNLATAAIGRLRGAT